MASASAVINTFESYDWDAQVFGALWAASSLAVKIRNKAHVIRLTYLLHAVNREMRSLLNTAHATLEGRLPLDPSAEPVTEQKLRTTIENLQHLSRTLQYVYESAKDAGLLNHSLTASALKTLATYHGPILDLVDWLELASQEDEVKAIFDRAARERDRGELFDLAQAE